MYLIVKVKFIDANPNHPRHKIVCETDSLERALGALEDVATQYVIKKLKPSFTELNSDDAPKSSTGTLHVESKYTMLRNKYDNNIIEIHEKKVITETKPGYVFGKNEKVIRDSKQIGYFYYLKFESESGNIPAAPIYIPSKLAITGHNPSYLKELKGNELFKKLQESVAQNQLNLEDTDTLEISSDHEY